MTLYIMTTQGDEVRSHFFLTHKGKIVRSDQKEAVGKDWYDWHLSMYATMKSWSSRYEDNIYPKTEAFDVDIT